MLTPDEASFITTAAEGLCTPLYEALDVGYSAAHSHYDDVGMVGIGYTKGRTDLTRDHARLHLERLYRDGRDLGGWQPVARGSGRLHLVHGAMTLRILHATLHDLIPAPGPNRARIKYYRNRASGLLGVEASNLLAVWMSPPWTGGDISVRIVRPVGAWKPGRTPKFDLDFELPRDSFTDWEFVPDDKGIELPFELDEDVDEDLGEEGEGSGA